MTDCEERLVKFLEDRRLTGDIAVLRADASTREYFRVKWHGETAIACVYPEPSLNSVRSYLDVTGLFHEGGLPVAEILDFDEGLGLIVQEDLGDRILLDELDQCAADQRTRLLDEAISLIAKIQAATSLSFERDSIASRRRFDTEKLLWELEYFTKHYFRTFQNRPLAADKVVRLTLEFIDLASDLDRRGSVLCHRDFHSANLMLDTAGGMRIIDHQDARIGSPAYDLVSLLLDRITALPTQDWLANKRRQFLAERRRVGLTSIEESDFEVEFNLQTIQRCLKAAGTFSYQSSVRRKTHFIQFIDPMFRAALRSIKALGRFPQLKSILEDEIK